MKPSPQQTSDPRLAAYRSAVETMKRGSYQVAVPASVLDDIGCLGQELSELASTLEVRAVEQQKLNRLVASINSGLMLEDILDNIFREFRDLIPYNRIGLALIDKDGRRVSSVWGKSDLPGMRIGPGYSASLSGSSLEKIIKTGQPRIISDLLLYLKTRPQSESTHLAVAEGIRSSLTCPLIVNNAPVGFLFFSSAQPDAYARVHVDIFQKIAQQVSMSVEKGRLVSELTASKASIEAQNEELRRLNEIKNTFLGVAAHDLRGPLSQIQMATNLVLDPEPWLSEEERLSLLKSILFSIEGSTRLMLARLNEMLDAAQIESGDLSLKYESMDLQAFVEEVVESHALLAASRGVSLVKEEAARGSLAGDPFRLRQVLDHLITSSIHLAESGETIFVRSSVEENQWVFSMRTDGASSSSRLPADGGLEMVIVRKVIEAHGGRLAVPADSGRSPRVSFSLPY
jgi:signal transduction histidine kinase